MPVTVVNIRNSLFTVYIGRANRRYNLPQSKWANPFKIGSDGDRDQVVDKYRTYIRSRADLMAALADINYAKLGCWCKPAKCHGDVLAELIAELDGASVRDV